jgi:hypothetical protein
VSDFKFVQKSFLNFSLLIIALLCLPNQAFSQTKGPIETYPPCVQATQELQQVNLDVTDYVGPEKNPPRTLVFMFKEDGVDVYAVHRGNPSFEWSTISKKWELKQEYWSALLIFQDEKARQEELRRLLGVGYGTPETWRALHWWAIDTYPGGAFKSPAWETIVDLKYENFEFSQGSTSRLDPASGRNVRIPLLEWYVTSANFFAPPGCYTRYTSRGRPISMIGSVDGLTFPNNVVPHDSLLYRVAFELQKVEEQEQQREIKEFGNPPPPEWAR